MSERVDAESADAARADATPSTEARRRDRLTARANRWLARNTDRAGTALLAGLVVVAGLL